MNFNLKKGIDLPIEGTPDQRIEDGPEITRVAVLGTDYVGMKPTMAVADGDRVKTGQVLFEDKKNPGVLFTSPGSGVVEAVHRGAKRALLSVVIALEGDEHEAFGKTDRSLIAAMDRQQVQDILVNSGMWTALRTRPYSKTPKPGSVPASIFVSAMDSNPLATDPEAVIDGYTEDFIDGLGILTRLTDGSVHVCQSPGNPLPAPDSEQVKHNHFAGPHPAGLVGTHIHFLDPVGIDKVVWHVGYQDVIAIGRLFTTGRIWTDRLISLAGPRVINPALIRTRLGASTEELVSSRLLPGESRVISGSVLSGQRAADALAYIRRFDTQVSVLREDRERELFGWLNPGKDKYSFLNVFVSSLNRSRKFELTTSQNGSPRAMVPLGNYEEVTPLDILPTQLLRALVVGDTDTAQALGCLELDEEDLALCSFVCPGKYDYGPVLRERLTQIEKEG